MSRFTPPDHPVDGWIVAVLVFVSTAVAVLIVYIGATYAYKARVGG